VRDKRDHEGEDESDGEHGGKDWAVEHTENTEGGEELL
jgi:hypothetical protein